MYTQIRSPKLKRYDWTPQNMPSKHLLRRYLDVQGVILYEFTSFVIHDDKIIPAILTFFSQPVYFISLVFFTLSLRMDLKTGGLKNPNPLQKDTFKPLYFRKFTRDSWDLKSNKRQRAEICLHRVFGAPVRNSPLQCLPADSSGEVGDLNNPQPTTGTRRAQ